MAEARTPNPEHTLAHNDPGDESANRYRFQWIWAAVMCCMLLDETEDVEEVFCEHHEDVLLKHHDGSFTGHQVKTRADNQPLWKARDEAVLAACARFAKLESEYAGQFRHFCFLTNHPLHSAGNGQDLSYVLERVKNAATVADLPPNVASWIRLVAKRAGVTEVTAFAAMLKTVAKADLPKLRDAVMRLISALSQCWPPAAECSHGAVERAAQSLVDECCLASSLAHEQLLPAYVIATVDPDREIAARIAGKRMTQSRVQAVLDTGRDAIATLEGDPTQCVRPGRGSTDLLHQKLDIAGFSAVSRNSAEDLRDKADYLGIRWLKQHGDAKGLVNYNHIRSLVFSDAGRAFDATQTKNDGFGPKMREEMRRRFQQRRAAREQLFDTTDDHLEGVAFSLTAECKIAWSHARPWESQ